LTASRAWVLMQELHSQCLLLFHTLRAPGVRPEQCRAGWRRVTTILQNREKLKRITFVFI
jgi:hypothetical protein